MTIVDASGGPHTQARARTQLPTQAHAHRVQYAHAHTRRFNEATQMYQLDFYGRAQVASCKNLLLIPIVRAKSNNQICFCSFIALLQLHTNHLRHDTRASSGRRRRRGKLLPAAARQNRGQSLQPRLQTTFLLRSGIWAQLQRDCKVKICLINSHNINYIKNVNYNDKR